MKRLALLLCLAVPAPLLAQELAPILPKQSAKGWYRTVREYREGGVITRKSFPSDVTLDGKAKFLYCMIPPAADWVLDSRQENIEEQYLRLVGRALHLDAILPHVKDGKRSIEQNTGVVGFCGQLRSPTPRVELDRINEDWRSNCQYSHEAPEIGRYTCTAASGGAVHQPKIAVAQTLNALAKSPHAKTAKKALDLMEDIKDRKTLFIKTISEVLLDTKTPPEARERAAEVLASVHTHDLSGHTLATIWGDTANPESLRRAALRGYSLVLSFGDPRTAGSDKNASGAIRGRLHRYLPSLLAVVDAETKENKSGKDTLSPLGEAARCVALQYSSRWLCYAKRNGETWYEALMKDEAAGLDACAANGKLKT